MTIHKAKWLLVGLVCLALWPVYASAQSSEWESYRYAGIHAHLRGDYTVAEPLYQRSLAIAGKALGPDHPDVAATLENYADLLRKTGRDAEAENMEARAKAIRAKHAKENP